MSRINFVPLIKQEGLQNAIIRNKKKLMPITGFAKRIETYDDIVSMPSNANGQISVTLKGNTYTNLVKNGLPVDTNGWRTYFTYSTLSIVNGFLRIAKNTHYVIGGRFDNLNIPVGRKIFVKFKGRANKAGTVRFGFNSSGFGLDNAGGIDFAFTTTETQFAAIITLTKTGNGFAFAGNEFNANGDYIEIKEVLAIDLTAYGLDSLTVDQCNQRFAHWFDGTKSTLCAFRSRAIGKNLVNPANYEIIEGKHVKLKGIKLEVGKRYTLHTLSSRCKIATNISAAPPNVLIDTALTNTTFTWTQDAQERMSIFVMNVAGALRENEVQIEAGNQFTGYEPYRESNAYVVAADKDTGEILELRSLPNGTKDEFNVVEGKHTKRASDPVSISNTMYASIDKTTYTNVDVVKTTAFSLAQAGTTGKDGMTRLYDKNGVELTEVAQTDIDNTASVGKYYWHTDKTLWIIVAKGAYADITAARTGLGTMTLIYQLASPIITKHEMFGDLKVFPSGTIYFEPTLWGFINFDYGQSSKTITTPDVPIGSIRKVIRYDITDDGRLVEVDVTADCTHNGTTLTIANAEPKKTYFYDCEIAPGYSTSAEKIIDVGTHEGVAVHDYGAAAADWVLSTNEALATMLVCINAGGAAKIIAPAAEGKMYIIRNESGQTITIKTASSTGVTVANGKTATVIFYNTDFIKIGEV